MIFCFSKLRWTDSSVCWRSWIQQVQLCVKLNKLVHVMYSVQHIYELNYNVFFVVPALSCSVLHCPALYYTVLFCITLSCSVLHCPVLYYTVLFCITLSCSVLHCPALYYTVLFCITLSCSVLHCPVLYYTVLSLLHMSRVV